MHLISLIPVQDQRLLQAVEHYGRNWSMIASTSLQNRTTLALKNRNSALQSKTQQPSETHVHDAQLGYMDFRSDPTSCNRSGSHGSSISGHNVRNAGGNSDEDEDEDDEEDEEDEPDDKGKQSYGETDPMSFTWQSTGPIMPVTSNGTSEQPTHHSSRTHTKNQPPFHLPSLDGNEQFFDPLIAPLESWGQDFQCSTEFPNTFPSYSDPTNFDRMFQQTPAASAMHTAMCPTSNYTASAPSYVFARRDQPKRYEVACPSDYLNPAELLNVPVDITDFGLPLDYSSLSHADHKTPHTSCPSPKGRASGQRSLVSSKRPRLSTTALPTDTATPYTEQTDVPSPSTQKTVTSSPRSPIHALHRVSVDAECTTEQLGDLMRTLVGVTKKVVIKIDEF